MREVMRNNRSKCHMADDVPPPTLFADFGSLQPAGDAGVGMLVGVVGNLAGRCYSTPTVYTLHYSVLRITN